MDNKQLDLSRRKQDSQQTDGRLKEFVEEISGPRVRQQYADSAPKSRIVDEQNKMIDKINLRK